MSRIMLVSNRLPVTVNVEEGEVRIEPSVGGLATGLSGPHQHSDSLWLGWPGDVAHFKTKQRRELERQLADLRTAPVYLTQQELNRYYEGFSNGVLWPLYHHLTDRLEKNAWRDWATFVEINQRFADRISECYQPGDQIWIHDYQLSLVPAMVRRHHSEATIGFFLHIPFPSSEVFRILPWRAEILKGMLGADLIGFHTYSYRRHFARALQLLLGLNVEGENVRYAGRNLRLGFFPMGVDAEDFGRMAVSDEVRGQAVAMRGDDKMLLGVDRLDYTKGLPHRLLAVERLLEREPTLRGHLRMIQQVVPSRTRVESYDRHRRELDELVGHINGRYGTVDTTPIHYLYRSAPRTDLIALYAACDVMVVTPLRDGMNLVAKEFVASRVDEDGVLVLSEFAGAAAELVEALQVNPYDIDAMASVLHEAINMPEDERRDRMRALRRRVLAYDSGRWAAAFLESLEAAGRSRQEAEFATVDTADVESTLQEVSAAEALLVVLDYDGTLVPFAATPRRAIPDNELKQLLGALAARAETAVHIVSGRTHTSLERWFGDLPIGLHAEHGYWSRMPGGDSWIAQNGVALDWKEQALPLLERFTAATPGSLIEEKTSGFAWHYRMTDSEFGEMQARQLLQEIDRQLDGQPIHILTGSKVIELRASGVHKGNVISHLLTVSQTAATVLAMGDDRTDEDMFAALPTGGVAIKVGAGSSQARLRLRDPVAARAFLRRLVEAAPEEEPQPVTRNEQPADEHAMA